MMMTRMKRCKLKIHLDAEEPKQKFHCTPTQIFLHWKRVGVEIGWEKEVWRDFLCPIAFLESYNFSKH